MTVSLFFGSSSNGDEFQQGLLAACANFCKAFDAVNRDALGRILGLRGVPPKLIDLISELYSGTESAVRCGGTVSDLFPVVTGVHQGCVLAINHILLKGRIRFRTSPLVLVLYWSCHLNISSPDSLRREESYHL